ncbi:MAG: efflux RND transporter periplasmic adaptor subunit [Prochloraceae cyanobacterium]|nr:efflux RND transporter periplasmic adaptor subunit [Prochloraceae cyanobacterium]
MTQQVSNQDTNSNQNISDLNQESKRFTDSSSLGLLGGVKGLFFGIVIGILVTLAGSRLILDSKSQQNTSNIKKTALPAKPVAGSVTATEVNISAIPRALKGSGSVTAIELIPVLSQATGLQITEVLADNGDFVKSGQVIARLNDRTLRAQLAQAEADVAAARARLQELLAGNRPEEIARAKQNVNFAEAEVSRATSELDLARKRVRRNQNLEVAGAITRDRLDEILNQERIKNADLQKARANAIEARERLAELQAGARSEVIARSRAELARAEAQMLLAREQLNNATITAPVSGEIARRNAKVGNTTTSFSQTPLFEIIEGGRLELQVKIPETELNALRAGQKVQISSDSNSNLNFFGTVREIDPVVDAESRLGKVKIDLPQNNSLKPGMFLEASILTDTAPGLSVPVSAVIPEDGDRGIVYKLENGDLVKAVAVKMGEILPNKEVEILSGLEAGDRIVVKGAGYLKNGDRVQVVQN